jgi:Acyl-CoA synthetases (AMP-forming)/AMP-acid ligases II
MSYEYQLTLDKLLTQTLHRASDREIVYGKTRYTWSKFYERVKRLASALESFGVKKGSKVAVIDYDTNKYFEAYYAIPMMGAILHTVNIRLPQDQIAYTMMHAEDDFVLVRDEFLPAATKLAPFLKSVKGVVVMSDSDSFSKPSLPIPVENYEELVSSGSSSYEFPELNENTVATLFYTSGTTGMPKGVWFTHRQLVLHTLSTLVSFSLSASPVCLEYNDVTMPLVPFFHVHCWGIPYTVGLSGGKIVLAGKYEPAKILETIKSEGVTFSNMVPTVLMMVLNHPRVEEYRESLSKWKVVIGGAALPKALALKAHALGIRVMSGYGLSETAPVLTIATPIEKYANLPYEELLDKVLLKTGLPVPLVKLRVVDDKMNDVPRDGKTVGEIVVRAPWLTKEYYKDPEGTRKLWEGGWLHTGDVAVIDQDGYITIVDRLKDVVKSGGEWISTLILEDLLMRHPAVLEAAVIGAHHKHWGERPVAVVYPKPGSSVTEEELKAHLMKFVEQGVIAKFWVPDRIVLTNEQLPRTSTGKFDKKPLREKYSKILDEQ